MAPARTRLVGLLGYPVEHSLSPAMHNAAFRALGLDWRYTLSAVPPEGFGAQVRRWVQQGYRGWNVTVPHKERIVPYLEQMSPEVWATGACNTVCVHEGSLWGYNTDVSGFLVGLAEAGGIRLGSLAVVLGAGGAARAVCRSLANVGQEVLVLARNAEQAASLAHSLQRSAAIEVGHGRIDPETLSAALPGASLLVNCTPAGMWPRTEETPLPQGTRLPEHLLVYDLVYRPRPTRLLREAQLAGCRTQDGLTMLVHQGAAAFEIWTGLEAPVETMRQACLEAALQNTLSSS